jgi:hypothetical protein
LARPDWSSGCCPQIFSNPGNFAWCNYAAPETEYALSQRARYTTGMEAPGLRLEVRAAGLPEKKISKNSASLITYPHSDSKRFENSVWRPSTLKNL